MSDKKFDLITIGDSTMDTFIKIHEATVECDINHQECKICVKYGFKIPVDSISFGAAGNAANVATGSALLGLSSAIYTNLGDDDHGRYILKALETSGVLADYVKINRGMNSNLSVVLTFGGERTIFVYHQDWFYQLPKLPECSWCYLTSMGESFANSNITHEVLRYVEKSGCKLVFAPGTFQLKLGVSRFPELLSKSELLIVNNEEAKTILGVDLKERVDRRDLLSKLLMLGPKLAVVTNGQEGSIASDGQECLAIGVLPTKVVEKTGAGDAYSSGMVAALSYGYELATAMLWGTINAGHVIQEVGAQNGLLDRAQIESHLKETRLRAVSF